MVSVTNIRNNPLIQVADKVFTNHGKFYMEKLSDAFYRGSEPSVDQFEMLAKSGVKTVLNLKTISKKELASASAAAEKQGLNYINIPLNPFRVKKSINKILQTIDNASQDNPLFIHCTYGKDRTGFVSALVNYSKKGFNIEQAIQDMESHGFRKHIFFNLERFLKQYDKVNLVR